MQGGFLLAVRARGLVCVLLTRATAAAIFPRGGAETDFVNRGNMFQQYPECIRRFLMVYLNHEHSMSAAFATLIPDSFRR